MTSQQDQIQRLIDEIDAVLTKANPRLPWVMSGEASQQRQVLEKTRSYLQSVQQGITVAGGWTQSETTPAESEPTGAEASAQQVLQSLLQEMEYLRANMLQPMRIEVDALQQERQALLEEVTELRQLSASPPPAPERALDAEELQDFLEGLMSQLQERLSQQVVETLSQLEADSDNQLLLQQAAAADADELELLSPNQRLAQMKLIQSQTDQLLLQMDGTLGLVFGALEKTVQSYQTSLSQGLENMHGLGQQGEVIFKALINHLAQQLSQEASAFLESGVLREAARAQLLASTQAEQAWDETVDELDSDFDDFDDLDDQLASTWDTAPEVTQIQADSAEASDPDSASALSGLDDLVLEDLDLDDDALGDEIEIDFDDEITQLQVNDSFDQDDEERTVIQEYRGPAGDPLELLSRWNEADQAIADALAANRAPAPPTEADPPAAEGEGYAELDDFYQSLFGDGAIAPDPTNLDDSDGVESGLEDRDEETIFEHGLTEPEADPVLDDLAPDDFPDDFNDPALSDRSEDDFVADDLETLIEPGAGPFAVDADPGELELGELDSDEVNADLTAEDLAGDELNVADLDAEDLGAEDLGTEDLGADSTADIPPAATGELEEDSEFGADALNAEWGTEPQGLDDLDDLGDFADFDDLGSGDDDETELLSSPPPAPDTAEVAPEAPDAEPPTLDSLLFGDSDLPEDGTSTQDSPTLGTLFSNEPDEDAAAELSSAPAADTITSLADLFPEDRVGQPATGVDLFEPDFAPDLNAQTWAEDAYIPAPSEEDLLIADDESSEEAAIDFDVDSGTLRQLSTDLSSLEGIDLESFDSFDVLSTPAVGTPPPPDNFPSSPPDSAEAVYTDYPPEPDPAVAADDSEDLFGDQFGDEPTSPEEGTDSSEQTLESLVTELGMETDPSDSDPSDSDLSDADLSNANPSGTAETDTAWTQLETAQTQEMPEAEVEQALFSDRLTTTGIDAIAFDQPPESTASSDDLLSEDWLDDADDNAADAAESDDDDSVDVADALALFADLPDDSASDPESLDSDDLAGTEADGTLDSFGDDFGSDSDLDVSPPSRNNDGIDTVVEQWEISGDEDPATTLDNLGLGDLADALGQAEGSPTEPETTEDTPFSLESLVGMDLDDPLLDLPSTPLEALGDAANLASEFSPMPPPPDWGATSPEDSSGSAEDFFGEAFGTDLADPFSPDSLSDGGSDDGGSEADPPAPTDSDSGLDLEPDSALADELGADLDTEPESDPEADPGVDLASDLGEDLFTLGGDDPEMAAGLEGLLDPLDPDLPAAETDADDLEDLVDSFADSFGDFGDTPATESPEDSQAEERDDELEPDLVPDLAPDLGLDLDSFDFDAPASAPQAPDLDTSLDALTPPPDINPSDFEAFLGNNDFESPEPPASPPPESLEDAPPLDLGTAGISEETASQEIDLSDLGPLLDMPGDGTADEASAAFPVADSPDVDLSGLGELDLDSLDLDAPEVGVSDGDLAADLTADPQAPDLEVALSALDIPDLDQPPPAEPEPAETVPQLWTLGLDLGTTGISAVLMERYSGDAYPLYWQQGEAGSPQVFRFPTQADLNLRTATVGAVGISVDPGVNPDGADDEAIRLHSLKTLLPLGVPHVAASSGQWQPQVQWSDNQTVSLNLVQESLRQLLQSVWPGRGNSVVCAAPKLSPEQVQDILQRLHSVVVGYPVNWPDTYSFNIREAVLGAGLVQQSEQIFFVEDSIAALLSVLPDPTTAAQDPAALTARQSTTLYCYPWQGGTVVINAGAHLTELAVADLPAELSQLNYKDFMVRSFAYGGDGIDQDIICQLIAPTAARTLSSDRSPKPHWQIAVDDFDAAWAALGFETLDLPRPSEPDSAKRCQLQQRLLASSLGQSLLQAARHLKVQLQGRQQVQFVLEVGPYHWLIQRKALEGQVFMPFIRRLNRHLNGLLSQTRLSPQGVKQVVSTGGAASLSAIARLLKDKFPNATTIYDTYAGDQARCSRVAYGLANLVRYPQVLDLVRQQYSDYFLLRELLRVFPDQPMPITGVMHLLEQRGINTQACQNHLLALLDGHLPPGLVPGNGEAPILSAVTQTDPLYVSLRSQPLFTKQASQIIVPNLEQCQRLRAYFGQLLHNKVQTLEEPLIGQLAPVLEG